MARQKAFPNRRPLTFRNSWKPPLFIPTFLSLEQNESNTLLQVRLQTPQRGTASGMFAGLLAEESWLAVPLDSEPGGMFTVTGFSAEGGDLLLLGPVLGVGRYILRVPAYSAVLRSTLGGYIAPGDVPFEVPEP